MKKIFIILSAILSISAFASDQQLLLDASCKVRCLINVKRVEGSQTFWYDREYANIYADFMGVTREQLDKKSESSGLDKLCKDALSEKAKGESIDCLSFKH